MKRTAFFLFLSLLLASCSSNNFRISTRSQRESGYRILSMRDSSLVVFPLRYSDEMTPELIREYARVIPFDSMTELRQESSSGVGEILLGSLAGSFIGGSIGAATYKRPANDGLGIITLFNAVTGMVTGGLIGIAVGGITGYILLPGEKDMLPPQSYKRELQQATYYRWGEPPEIEKIK